MYARRGGRVLLILHHRIHIWVPIGGELEPGETPLEAAIRELREESGLVGDFPRLANAPEGEPPGYIGYEEHVSGAKGLHMNHVFVADVPGDAIVTPNDEYADYRWVDRAELATIEPTAANVRDFGYRALDAKRG